MAVSAIAILAMLQIARPAQTNQTGENQNQSPVKVPVQVDPNTPVALQNAKIGVMTSGFDSSTAVNPSDSISVMVGLNYRNQIN